MNESSDFKFATRNWNFVNDQPHTNFNLLTDVAFKICAPFFYCIIKIDEATVGDAKDLDLLMSIYNLLYAVQSIYYNANLYNTAPIILI